MSPTRHLWKPFCAKTRTAASRISRRLSSPPFDRSVNLRSIVEALQDIVVVDLTRYLPRLPAGAVREPRAAAARRACRAAGGAAGRSGPRHRAGVGRAAERRQG